MADKWFTGVGSRDTPDHVQSFMGYASHVLTYAHWGLRTGEARGADAAFDRGAARGARKEVYTPERGARGHNSPLFLDAMEKRYEAWELVQKYHPYWTNLKDQYHRRLITRNVFQVLGPNLDDPSDFVVAWTVGGALKGGTAWTLILAQKYEIPIYNLGSSEGEQRFRRLLSEYETLDM